MHHVFAWVDIWIDNRYCSRKQAPSLLTRGKSWYWVKAGKVSKWEGNKWKNCLTNGKERIGPRGHFAGWRRVSMGVMKAVGKVKTELGFTRSISKQRTFRMDQRQWWDLHALSNSISYWDLLSHPSWPLFWCCTLPNLRLWPWSLWAFEPLFT